MMLRSLLLLAVAACSIDERIDEATDRCRAIVEAAIPRVAIAVAAVCDDVGDDARDAILIYLGCLPPDAGGIWDCVGAHERVCGAP
jgi:hypothetical protein